MAKKKQVAKEGSMEEPEMDMRKIMKEIEFLGSSRMTWNERKALENKRIVSLGGKPTKKQRLPLSVARAQMKNQKEREQKILQERLILGRFERKLGGGTKRAVDRRMPEERVLKSSEGHFRNGVLDVKHLLHSGPSRKEESSSSSYMSRGKKKKGGGKNKQGKKGKGKKRH